MTTIAEQLTNLQNDKKRITEAFDLDENLTFTDIAKKAEDGEIGGGGGSDLVDTMKDIDITVEMFLSPKRVFSEKDYTQEEVQKVQNLCNILGGN